MSADNYYLIRKHPTRDRFVALMGFESDETEVEVNPNKMYVLFESYDSARRWAETQNTEYGVRVHPECYISEETGTLSSKPAIGDHVQDGGEWGTIVRCHECGGTGQLHQLDEMPTAVTPSDVDSEIVEIDKIIDRSLGRSMPVVIENRTCPKCRHAWHTQLCLNMASDNDCSCVSSTVL